MTSRSLSVEVKLDLTRRRCSFNVIKHKLCECDCEPAELNADGKHKLPLTEIINVLSVDKLQQQQGVTD